MAVNGVERRVIPTRIPPARRKDPIGLQIHAGASEVEHKDIKLEVDPKEDRINTVEAAQSAK